MAPTPPDAAVNRRAALLQDLLRGIAELIPVVSGFSRTHALVLAEEAIRIDPSSAPLREAATELQRAADTADPAARSKALTAASAATASEARRASADAPLTPPLVAPALGGAFVDAIARPRIPQ